MKINSKYFSFNEQSKSINNIDFSSYFGWSGLNVTKFIIPEASEITNFQLNHIFPDLKEKEKIFVIIKFAYNIIKLAFISFYYFWVRSKNDIKIRIY